MLVSLCHSIHSVPINLERSLLFSGSKRDSLKSNVSSYGTLRAVKAPTVPQEYNQNSEYSCIVICYAGSKQGGKMCCNQLVVL